MTERILETRELKKAFGGLAAVGGVSMDVVPGEIHGVIGPNGAGKTTLLNLITGFLTPDEGGVSYRGEAIEDFPPHMICGLGIARTFQQIRLFRHMTVLENCLAGMHMWFSSALPAILGRGRRFRLEEAERIEEATELLRRFGLGERLFRPAGELPYGEQRRLEIIRALGSRPTLLCLDEPAAGMNEAESEELSDLIRQLSRGGLSIILIEHDMAVVRKSTDRVTVLNEGKVIAHGSPEEALSDPQVIEAYLGRNG
jgi:branched-chain amino acid transport system ATP-binding protein